MPRRRVVSRTLTYTTVRCLLRILPDGLPVEKEMYIEGEYTDKRKAYRSIRKQLQENKTIYLVRIVELSVRTEQLRMPVNEFIKACKEDKTSNV